MYVPFFILSVKCQMVHSKNSATLIPKCIVSYLRIFYFFFLVLNFLPCLIFWILINVPVAVPREGGHQTVSEALPTEAVYRGVRGAPEKDQGVAGTPHPHRATLHAGEVY